MNGVPGTRWRATRLLVPTAALFVVALMAIPSVSAATASLPTSGGQRLDGTGALPRSILPHANVTLSSADDWPEMHQTPLLDAFAYNSPLTSANATHLGVAWDTDMFGAALDSPVAAYDPVLHETLAYVGTESGNVLALNLANGQIVWGVWLGSPIRSTPLVYNGSLYVGTFTNPEIFRFNATTGATQCSAVSKRPLEGTPTLATPPGGVPTLFIGSEDDVAVDGAMEAVNALNCTLEWQYSNFGTNGGTAGTWTPAAYVVAANGTPLVVFGTADPDAGVYALDALTGALEWRFQAANPPPGVYDIGAGAAISPPGKNGFAEGVAYVPSKYGYMYALNLQNGTPYWSTNFDQLAGLKNGVDGGRSTPALDGGNLIFGYNQGLFDLNAKTGALLWQYIDPAKQESIASPAIAGGHGSAIVATADLAGGLDVLSVTSGTPLFRYQTGGYITASPAVVGGNILLSSTDGFLYDFAVGGGSAAALPTTSVSYPAAASNLTNPNGNLTVRGNATDSAGVAGVEVAIQQNGISGNWWDGSTQSWVSGPHVNWATLSSVGAAATAWSYAFPPARGGGAYVVTAYAVSTGGQSDIHPAVVGFGVTHSTQGPHIEASQAFVPPGDRVVINGAGFNASEKVRLTLTGTTLATVTASKTGAIPATSVKIPFNTPFGETSVTATGEKSGKSSSTAIVVANSWDQLGDTTGHTNYEPNDPTLNFLVHPGGNYWVQLAWDFTTGSALDTTPAVVQGVAYVADQTGNVYALDDANGGMLWNWTLPSGDAIYGSPSVDPTLGLVFVGASDGTVNAIDLTTGTTAWAVSIGGNVSAPEYANGSLYVTSTNGKVEALNESTGAKVWSTTLPSAVETAASLNLTAGVLVLGQSDGNVTELRLSTGATVWNFKTGGPVVAAPTVSGGVVYVGSMDKNVYALSQSTGASLWSYATGSAVTDSGALVSHYTYNGGQLEYAIGSGNGDVYVLDASSGTLDYSVSVKAPIVGIASAEGIIVMTSGKGQISATRAYTPLVVWKETTSGGLMTAPVIVDGAIYVDAGDGHLYVYTTFGQAPD